MISFGNDTISKIGIKGTSDPRMVKYVYVGSELVFDDHHPLGDEIMYIPVNNAIVTPSSTVGFNANIVSNSIEYNRGIIKFDNNLTSLGFFYDCRFEKMFIPNGVTIIPSRCFNNINCDDTVKLPESVTSLPNNVFDSARMMYFESSNALTSIGSEAFYNATVMAYIYLNDSVQTIGDRCFKNIRCGDIQIGTSINSIGSEAFKDCSGLYRITIKRNDGVIPTLGTDAITTTFSPNLEIAVPSQMVDAYKANAYWRAYADLIIPIE